MKDFIVLVDQIKDWQVYHPSEHIIAAKNYLFDTRFGNENNRITRVLNLCKSYKYLSLFTCLLFYLALRKMKLKVRNINDISTFDEKKFEL